MNNEDKINKLEARIINLEAELEGLYTGNSKLVTMYKAIQELQALHEAPANKFTHYLG
tara:strand:- start:634 stop:807 length:174 start_codon:yes stop_codon:yes gene_type:complete